MLANLVFVTRPESEIASLQQAEHWVGLPEYESQDAATKVVIMCDTEADRDALLEQLGVAVISQKNRGTWSFRWPLREEAGDPSAVRFDDA